MGRFRIILTLIWMLLATSVQASGVLHPVETSASISSALLSGLRVGGTAIVVRAESPPVPVQDAKALPSVAAPISPRSSASWRTAGDTLEIVEQLSALPYPPRGPPGRT